MKNHEICFRQQRQQKRRPHFVEFIPFIQIKDLNFFSQKLNVLSNLSAKSAANYYLLISYF